VEQAVAQERDVVRAEFTLQSTLLGWPGATQRFIAAIVPPAADEPAPARDSIAEEFSAARRSSGVAD
jgi:hypothetical protein